MAAGLRLSLALGLALPAFAAVAGPVTVRVGGVTQTSGRLWVAVCERKELRGRCANSAVVPATPGALVPFPSVPPGRYAAKVFWDVNGNGRADVLGRPREPYAFSGPRSLIPDFEKAAFDVRVEPVTVDVHLRP